MLAALPYEWNDVAGTIGWADGVVSIHSLSGWHNDTYIEVVGRDSPTAAYVDLTPRRNVFWKVHLEDVRIRQLVCDDQLKQALPDALAGVVEELDPRGPLGLDFGADIKGGAGDLVTAQWWLRARLEKTDFVAGVELKDATGNVEIVDGIWDGSNVTADGYVELSSARVLDMPIHNVSGPFVIDGSQIVVGTPGYEDPGWRNWLAAPVVHTPELNRYASRELSVDDFYSDGDHDGRFGMEGVVHIGAEPSQTQYRFFMSLENASLRAWARDQQIPAQRLRGAVNGRLTLTGRGPSSQDAQGVGWVQIYPAELYELPVFAQVFALPNFRPVEKTAFSYAYSDFTLHDGLFDFSKFTLEGDALDLIGQGTVEYAEELPRPRPTGLLLEGEPDSSRRARRGAARPRPGVRRRRSRPVPTSPIRRVVDLDRALLREPRRAHHGQLRRGSRAQGSCELGRRMPRWPFVGPASEFRVPLGYAKPHAQISETPNGGGSKVFSSRHCRSEKP